MYVQQAVTVIHLVKTGYVKRKVMLLNVVIQIYGNVRGAPAFQKHAKIMIQTQKKDGQEETFSTQKFKEAVIREMY